MFFAKSIPNVVTFMIDSSFFGWMIRCDSIIVAHSRPFTKREGSIPLLWRFPAAGRSGLRMRRETEGTGHTEVPSVY